MFRKYLLPITYFFLSIVMLTGCALSEEKGNTLPASNSISATQSAEKNKSNYLKINKPEKSYATLEGDRIKIKGTNDPSVSKIVVIYKNEEVGLTDEYTLTQFKKGDTEWEYAADIRYKNLAGGPNQYRIIAYTEDNGKLIKLQEEPITIFAIVPVQKIKVPEGNQISVDFLSKPKPLDTNEYFKSIKLYEKAQIILGESFSNEFEFHELGTVKSGFYAGNQFLLMRLTSTCGMGGCGNYRVLRQQNGNFIILAKHSDAWWAGESEFINSKIDTLLNIRIDEESTIRELILPDVVAIPNSKYKLIKQRESLEFFDEKKEGVEGLFFSDPIGQFFYRSNGCILTKNKDGTFTEYLFDFDFIHHPDESSATSPSDKRQGKFYITWNDGFKTTDYYDALRRGGCGSMGNCYTMANAQGLGELVLMGKTDTGENVYIERYTAEELDKLQTEYSKGTSFTRELEDVYSAHFYPITEKPSMRDFYFSRPVIYIKDPFGALIKFTKMEFIPMAECGKPVIYLYPEVEADISVEVRPTGGFTKTEPAYKNGWRVRATPESKIFNYDDGIIYPYLFWEGRALGYDMPEKGFVVEKANVESFLKEKLSLQGLNAKEIADFVEFWVPRMQEKPYYFVTFIPQPVFDKLAPLKVKPRPDTVIRVFMDYKGLDQKIKVEPLTFETPEREGFVVVEWGGETRD